MTQNRDFFKAESVDEQVDQFSLSFLDEPGTNQAQTETRRVKEFSTQDQIEHRQNASMRLVKELQAYYQVEHQQNLGILEHAWGRIAAHLPANHASAQVQNTFLSSPLLRSSQARIRTMQSQPSTDHSTGRKISRSVSLLAATLVAALLVGMLVAVLALGHNHQSNTVAAGKTVTPTATPLPVGSVVYTRSLHTGTNVYPFIAWSPDSKRIATVVFNQQSQKAQLQIWDATTGGHLLTVPLADNLAGDELLWSPTGKYLVLGNLLTQAIIDSQTGSIVNTLTFTTTTVSSTSVTSQSLLSSRIPSGGGFGFYSVAWTPDGSSLAVAVSSLSRGIVELINPLTSAVQATFSTPAYRIGIAMAFSSDGQYLAVSYPNDSKIVVWNVSTQAIAFQQDDYQAETIAWQPSTHHLARALVFPAETQVWDISSQKLLKTYAGVTAFTWSPDGKELAAYTSFIGGPGQPNAKTNEVVIIEAASGVQVALYQSQHRSIYTVSWSPDGRYIATAEASSAGNQIVVWIA
jgi:WD40 repeat protein